MKAHVDTFRTTGDARHPVEWRISSDDPSDRAAIFVPSVGEYPIYDQRAHEFVLTDQKWMEMLEFGLRS